MATAFPSAYSTFVRDHDASNKMVIDYARNQSDFMVNKYTQVQPVKKPTGLYLEMTVEEAGRVVYSTLEDRVWADGQEAPQGLDGLEKFEYKAYRCERYAYPFRLGDMTVENASWDILAQHASIKTRQAMTARTQLAITALTTTGSYAATHQLDVTTISGNTGDWASSTTARQDIKRSLIAGAEVILDDTLGAVKADDIMLVINSALAGELAECQEIVDFIKGSPDALAEIRGEKPGTNVIYGLPSKLYGFPLIVESTRKVTTKKGQTTARSQILAAGTPFMCSRPGGLVGVAGAPSFSTCVGFANEEMTIETIKDAPNRRQMGRVVENLDYVLVAPASGVIFSAAT